MTSQFVLIMGNMNASKSTRVVTLSRQFKMKGFKVKLFKHAIDTRYDDGNFITTHDKVQEPCTPINNTEEIFINEDYADAQVIIIDEGQFFGKDILTSVRRIVNVDNKHLIISGLSGDYKMEPFGYMNNFLSMANTVEMLKAYCHFCDDITPCEFTVKISGGNEQVEIGTSETFYRPCCRKHYMEYCVI
jgi:thymidine kinase